MIRWFTHKVLVREIVEKYVDDSPGIFSKG